MGGKGHPIHPRLIVYGLPMTNARATHPSYRYANLDAKPLPGDRVCIVDTEIRGTVVKKFTGVSVVVDWEDGEQRLGAGRIRNLNLEARA